MQRCLGEDKCSELPGNAASPWQPGMSAKRRQNNCAQKRKQPRSMHPNTDTQSRPYWYR